MLEIRVLGSPVITLDGDPVEVDTRKAIAVLAYLAVEGSADRDVLADLFWADSPPDRSRATLRRTLSALRGGIGHDAISADRNRVTLNPGHHSDIAGFESAMSETATHQHDPGDVCAACLLPLENATSLYRGDFLGAFSIKGSPEFEDWARSVTESYRLKAGDAFRRLAMAHAGEGNYGSALEAVGRWIGLDELHEPAHRLAMLLHAWAGDRAGAMQAYRACMAVLDRELGVPPLEETTGLYEAILDEDLPPAPGARRQVRSHAVPVRPAPRDMIDRHEAVDTVERALASIGGGPRLLVVTGDSWMGKTRLLDYLNARANEIGHRVAAGTAFRAETGLPYGLAVQLLAGLDITSESTGGLPDWVRDELYRLEPRQSPGLEPLDSGQLGQLRLREAFLNLVETIASQLSLVLIIDDAQWIDPASANLLAHVQRRARTTHLLTVISTRGLDSMHPALRELASEPDETIVLSPLRATDLADDQPDVDIAAILHATGGIPLLVQEAIESGGVDPDSSTVAKYMESRRRRMSALGRQVLAAAAVLDGMCDAPLLKDTSGRTEEEVVEAVEELVSAGLLREQEDGRLSFTLDILETVTYESTSLIRRRLLHRRAAEAIAGRTRAEHDVRFVTAIADHSRAAGSDDVAVWYRRAGDLSREVFAIDEAAASYELALALGHPDTGAIRLALGELAMARGDFEAATRELRTAASHAEGSTLALVEHRMGDLNRVLGRFELAEESFAHAEPGHPRKSELFADWALLRHRLDDSERATDLAERAVAEAETSMERARGLNVLGVVTSDPELALSHIEHALESAGSNVLARMGALNNKAHLVASAGDYETAISLVTEAADIASRTGHRHRQAALLNHLADLYHRAGRRADAETALTEAVTIFADIDSGAWEPEVWLLRQW